MSYEEPSSIENNQLVENLTIGNIYPNPFDAVTSIEYSIPVTTKIELSIHNSLGQVVTVLVNKTVTAGRHTIDFDASLLTSGVYTCKLKSDSETISKQILIIK